MEMARFSDRGLIPAIVQDADTGRVLTLAYMNEEALRRTLKGPDVWFYSRSRQELWHKGATSGNYLKVQSAALDCYGNAILVQAKPTGPACHTGNESCFFTKIPDAGTEASETPEAEYIDGPGVLTELLDVIEDRRRNPREGSYTGSLLAEGAERVAQKVVEEAGETAIAAVGDRAPERLPQEVADLLYHALVLLSAAGVSPDTVWRELRARRG